jgi:hypothetical protein
MDKTSLAIALSVVIILLLCAPQAERSRALGRMVVIAGIGLAVYYIVPAVLAFVLALWSGAVYRFGFRSVFFVTVLVVCAPFYYLIARQDRKEDEAIRAGSQEAFDSRVSYLERHSGYTHERAVEAAIRVRDGDKKTTLSQAEPSQKETQEVTGIGGWLLLLIIRLWIGAVTRTIGGLATGLSLPGILSFGYAALAGVAAFLLGRKSAKGVMAAKSYLAADGLYYALALLDSMIGDATPQLNSSFPPWFKPSGYLIASVLWIVYLARSERVKNTYFLANAEVAQAPSRRSGWSQ